MQTPQYEPGNVVYLRESAAIGHIEAVTISGLSYYNGTWLYTIRAGRLMPTSVPQYGDRVSMVNGQTLQFSEAELIPLCEALALAEANATIALDKIRAQRTSLCHDITDQ
jgi:hypothetical protein